MAPNPPHRPGYGPTPGHRPPGPPGPAGSDHEAAGQGDALHAVEGFAHAQHAGPVHPHTLALLACTARLRTILLDRHGAVLHLGRAHRLATPTQKRALLARDIGCVIPGCPAPGEHCDVHHVIPWAHGGATDLPNLVLLCPRHHAEIDTDTGWHLQMIHGVPWARPPTWAHHQPTPPTQHHPPPPHRQPDMSAVGERLDSPVRGRHERRVHGVHGHGLLQSAAERGSRAQRAPAPAPLSARARTTPTKVEGRFEYHGQRGDERGDGAGAGSLRGLRCEITMRARVSIGDFSRMTHFSVKIPRHYHEIDVLVPADVDPSAGRRARRRPPRRGVCWSILGTTPS